mmetsp:Transcript_13072/g.36791  ORF Transcript_13072/g.36791 Transcript_13072/m.36791 type:complete len:499 (-) Transcript_13072:515-2011(-)
MSSVVVSGDSSSDGESSEVSGGVDNPIEIDDSTSRNSESDSEMPPAGPICSNITAKADPDKETDRGEGNHSGEDGDEENSDDEGDSAERSSESPAVDETEIDRNESDDDGDDDENGDGDEDEDEDEDNNFNPPPKAPRSASETAVKTRKQMWGDIESMLEIEKSPYEGNECAEVGEDCFEELRTLLHNTGRRGHINPKMVALLGDKLAFALCNAHYEIGKSGILYSANWREGRIRDSDFGWIPKRQLLLCLHEHRFARGSESLLQAVAKNLDCTQLILDAMDLWNLTQDYPNLVSTRGEDTFIFGTQKVSCYKCEIFVARAFATLHLLNQTHEITQSLTKKIKECLIIMNKHVRPNQIELARLQKKSRKRIERANTVARMDRSKSTRNSKKPRNIGTTREFPSSGGATPILAADKPTKRRRRKNKVEERDASKHRRKVQKCEEREESLLMLFDNMHAQAQRLNQMMTFFQTQLRDHRSILREEISEQLSSDQNKEAQG